ncbi:uncharacterized protein EI90DRAFT_2392046 [Cantharellus anzutake]|uniref:uncharacterized protein n=1 Tax=Cantharellus anzutake TaxID=1750568 RepID=UPI0019051700|nr:uncharacterized protein EI90DRAFT_2392046 [Cantharellus anzutake]KAF8323551.1 hypothetical protein EI90DRAFT_2392046 [Cantharellus anzutake]
MLPGLAVVPETTDCTVRDASCRSSSIVAFSFIRLVSSLATRLHGEHPCEVVKDRVKLGAAKNVTPGAWFRISSSHCVPLSNRPWALKSPTRSNRLSCIVHATTPNEAFSWCDANPAKHGIILSASEWPAGWPMSWLGMFASDVNCLTSGLPFSGRILIKLISTVPIHLQQQGSRKAIDTMKHRGPISVIYTCLQARAWSQKVMILDLTHGTANP